jgi:predicted transcriptional regulator
MRQHPLYKKSDYPWRDVAINIALSLLDIMDATGQSKTELADKAGLPRETVNLIVKGQYDIKLSELVKIQKACGFTLIKVLD